MKKIRDCFKILLLTILPSIVSIVLLYFVSIVGLLDNFIDNSADKFADVFVVTIYIISSLIIGFFNKSDFKLTILVQFVFLVIIAALFCSFPNTYFYYLTGVLFSPLVYIQSLANYSYGVLIDDVIIIPLASSIIPLLVTSIVAIIKRLFKKDYKEDSCKE